jgi:hypothetical protein
MNKDNFFSQRNAIGPDETQRPAQMSDSQVAHLISNQTEEIVSANQPTPSQIQQHTQMIRKPANQCKFTAFLIKNTRPSIEFAKFVQSNSYVAHECDFIDAGDPNMLQYVPANITVVPSIILNSMPDQPCSGRNAYNFVKVAEDEFNREFQEKVGVDLNQNFNVRHNPVQSNVEIRAPTGKGNTISNSNDDDDEIFHTLQSMGALQGIAGDRDGSLPSDISGF